MITLTTRLTIFCYLGMRSFRENPEPESVGLTSCVLKKKREVYENLRQSTTGGLQLEQAVQNHAYILQTREIL